MQNITRFFSFHYLNLFILVFASLVSKKKIFFGVFMNRLLFRFYITMYFKMQKMMTVGRGGAVRVIAKIKHHILMVDGRTKNKNEKYFYTRSILNKSFLLQLSFLNMQEVLVENVDAVASGFLGRAFYSVVLCLALFTL